MSSAEALALYEARITVLREHYRVNLAAIEKRSAEEISARINALGPVLTGMPAFRELIDRWSELDDSTKIGREHRRQVEALNAALAEQSRAIRKELGL